MHIEAVCAESMTACGKVRHFLVVCRQTYRTYVAATTDAFDEPVVFQAKITTPSIAFQVMI